MKTYIIEFTGGNKKISRRATGIKSAYAEALSFTLSRHGRVKIMNAKTWELVEEFNF